MKTRRPWPPGPLPAQAIRQGQGPGPGPGPQHCRSPKERTAGPPPARPPPPIAFEPPPVPSVALRLEEAFGVDGGLTPHPGRRDGLSVDEVDHVTRGEHALDA